MNRACFLAILMAGASLAAPAQCAPVGAAPPDGTVFDALDTNHDQQLSRQEFQAGYAGLQRAFVAEQRLRGQFRSLDADASGALEAGEYAQLVLVRQAGAKAPAHAAFDADRSGGLDFGEYLAVVRALSSATAAAPES